MIEIEERDGIAVLRMVRGKGNALNVEFLEALCQALANVEAGSAGALVITGEGRNFSAGVDLPRVTEGGAPYLAEFLPALTRCLRQAVLFSKPLVAAVNGHAIAGGCIIMLAADYRVLSRGDGRVGLTELLVGVPFPTWPLEIARHAIPRTHFRALCYTGRLLSSAEAFELGLADELVEPDELLPRACAMAQQFAAVPRETFRLTKRHVTGPLVAAAEGRAAADDPAVSAAWCSEAVQERICEFAARTIGRR